MIKNTRFTALDELRGIAILGVVIYHFGMPYSTYYPGDSVELYTFPIGELGVQLFFMISGFVILLSASGNGTAKDFAISRFSRLYPTYWVSLCVSVALIIIVGIETRHITWKQVLINLTMFQRFLFVDNVDQVYWTLAVEMQFYILVFIYLWLSKGKVNRKHINIFTILWAVAGLILCVLYANGSENGLAKILIWIVLAEHGSLFCFGISLFYYSRDKNFNWSILFFALVSSINSGIRNGLMHGVVVFMLAILFFLVVKRGELAWLDQGPLRFLGKISYSWYLCHTIMGFMVIHLTYEYIGYFPSVMLAFILTIWWACLINQAVEIKISKKIRQYLSHRWGGYPVAEEKVK